LGPELLDELAVVYVPFYIPWGDREFRHVTTRSHLLAGLRRGCCSGKLRGDTPLFLLDGCRKAAEPSLVSFPVTPLLRPR
jgi:hypothetical protein